MTAVVVAACSSSGGTSSTPTPTPSVDAQTAVLLAFTARFGGTEAAIKAALAQFDSVTGGGGDPAIRAAAVIAADQIATADASLQGQAAPSGLGDAVSRLLADDKELSDGLRAINDHNLSYNQAVRDVIVQSISLRNGAAADLRRSLDSMLRARNMSPVPG